MWRVLRSCFFTLLFLAYPYLIYRGMESGVIWLAPAILSILYCYQALQSTKFTVRAGKLLIAFGLLLGAGYFQALAAKLMPIFIQLFLLHFFASTLFKGPPLVERFVRFDYPEYPPEVEVYARQLTILWSVFFAVNAVICTVMALWASDAWWAFYTGILIYTFTGLLILGEYIYRHFRFPGWEIPPLKQTFQNMLINGRKIWQEVHGQK